MLKKRNHYFIYDKPQKISIKFIVKKVGYLLFAKLCMLFSMFFRVKSISKDYNVSICAIFKNEGPYLKEWIEYHKIIGVNHFYLYNNNSTDNYLDILRGYIENGEVTLINWEKNQAQLEAYRHCIDSYSSYTKWIGFIDLDEFVVPRLENNIYDVLKRFDRNAGSVLVYWKVFGSSGRLNRNLNGLVAEDFTISWDRLCDIGKCFYNTNFKFCNNARLNHIFHHFLWTKHLFMYMPPKNVFGHYVMPGYNPVKGKEIPIQINHYLNKSLAEYELKQNKGDVFFSNNPHNYQYYLGPESQCMGADYSIFKYMIELKQKMKCEH